MNFFFTQAHDTRIPTCWADDCFVSPPYVQSYTLLGSRACLRLISKWGGIGGAHRGTDSLPIFELPKAAFPFPFVCGKSCKIALIKLVLLRGERIIHSAKKKSNYLLFFLSLETGPSYHGRSSFISLLLLRQRGVRVFHRRRRPSSAHLTFTNCALYTA